VTFKWTSGAMFALALAGAGCKSDDRSQHLTALEQRVAKLEAATEAAPPAPPAPSDAVARLEQRIDALEKQLARTMKTTRIPLVPDRSGNELCADKGHICLSVVDGAGSARYDMNNNFCGHITADCSSRISLRKGCGVGADYVLSPVKFHRSPGAKAQCDSSTTESCATSPSEITAICLE
jgi:outer membrane murein-binding lipoprotein Lpp